MPTALILMTFKPVYALEIVDGLKKCEVRSYLGRLSRGDLILIYASTPIKSLIGEFICGNVYVGSYLSIIKVLKERCLPMSEENLGFIKRNYSLSRKKLILIEVLNPVKYRNYIPLSRLREVLGKGFKPPRSYLRILPGSREYRELMELREVVR